LDEDAARAVVGREVEPTVAALGLDDAAQGVTGEVGGGGEDDEGTTRLAVG